MATGFCDKCPTPENLAEYRNGKDNGGYFSNPLVREAACRLIEQLALTAECAEGPWVDEEAIEDAGEAMDVILCQHPVQGIMSSIGLVLEGDKGSVDVVVRVANNRGDND